MKTKEIWPRGGVFLVPPTPDTKLDVMIRVFRISNNSRIQLFFENLYKM